MSKIELSKWQNPEDGFPKDEYRDAVMAALEKAGIPVHDYWRDERWDFNFELDRAAFADGPLSGAHDVVIGWRVAEESDPAHCDEDESWHGFHSVADITGWFWMRCKESGEGINPKFLNHPDYPLSPISPLAEPAVVASAVLALVRGESKEG